MERKKYLFGSLHTDMSKTKQLTMIKQWLRIIDNLQKAFKED